MKQIEELGICPNCDCTVYIYKTKNYKRFAKCEICGLSYPLPKKGLINNSALLCPKSCCPILIIERPDQKAYFWADKPCFSCIHIDDCIPLKELIKEFKELERDEY